MKKTFIYICIISFLSVFLTSCKFNDIIRLFKGYDVTILCDLKQYAKTTDEFYNIRYLNTEFEYDGSLFFIQPSNKKLYEYIDESQSNLMCDQKMDYAIIKDRIILYLYNDELWQLQLNNNIANKISKLYKNSNLPCVVGNKLYF